MLFLSHSSKDEPLTRRLAAGLEEAGYAVWLDEWKIRVGECIATAIEHALSALSVATRHGRPRSLCRNAAATGRPSSGC